ncbi:hypothetical protein M8J75_005065 [Diaphorina citri]|nr:hypothetical protein M8J75_005065 [Diaphorina citri]
MADTDIVPTEAVSSTDQDVSGDRKRKLDELEESNGNEQQKKVKEEEEDGEKQKEEEVEGSEIKEGNGDNKDNVEENETKEGDEGKDNTEEKPDANKEEFAYSKRGDFTSEVYKIIVRGLPKYFGISEVRKHFETFLNTKLCKLIPLNKKRNRWNDSGVFITFYDEKTRQHALTKLNGYRFKGKVLSAVKANALPDPFVMKQKAEKAAEDLQKQSEMCTEEKLKDCTIPLWNMPYEEQLELKMSDMRKQVVEMIHSIERYQPALKPWFDRQREINNGLPVQLDQIRPCKRPEGYRNKCEFSIGLHPQTKEKTVGFRYGKYSEGSVYIGPVYNLIHIHDRMKAVVRVFENYVRGSRFDIFDVVTQGGHWKLLMCRYSDSSDELMIKIGFDPQDLPEEELNKVREELKDFFENSDEGKEIRLAPGTKAPPVELLSGRPTISQALFSLNFNISPVSFFQVNTEACHTLYDTVAELAELGPDTTLLDICSGVGTIGLCLASRCGEVLGVESNEDAVADAKLNASSNSLSNCTFYHGKAEDITSALIGKARFDSLVAVLDPPRAGIHQRLATTLRASNLERIVYLACDTKSVLSGFNGLTFAPSKKFAKAPFLPVRVVPVDMFPYTRGVEWVILMQRWDTLVGDI